MRRVLPPAQDGGAFGGRQNVEPAKRQVGRRNRRRQQPHQPAPQLFDAGAIEQVASIGEPQPQLISRPGHQAHRIVRSIVPTDAGETQPTGLGERADALDRIVLEHHQGIK